MYNATMDGKLHLLFDADGTLYDFAETERRALSRLFGEYGIDGGSRPIYEEGNRKCWEMYEDGRISIRIADNGVGMPQDVLSSLLDPGSSRSHLSDGNGIGLENINERLKLYYGDEYGLSIESELDAGTAVTITIPHLNPIQPVVVMRR